MLRSNKKTLVLTAVMLLGTVHGHAQTVRVGGPANPYLADQPNGTTCCGGDTAPAQSPVLALHNLTAGESLTFSTSGSVGYDGSNVAPSADGFTDSLFGMAADNGTGISGPLNVYVSGLVGVFTSATPPSGPAPSQLNSGVSFKKLAPGLNQIFWIGDGLTGTGTGARQKFIVPTGATSLYLGDVDGAGWFNNTGRITVKMHVKPAASFHGVSD